MIFKSKIRREIFKCLFLSNKEFYLSEIARQVSTSVGTCQRELDRLVMSSILISQKKDNRKIYAVDKKNPFYRELKSIINKTIGIDGEIKRMIKKIPEIEYAFIFGSYSKGYLSNNSDIDLFIIGLIDENEFSVRLRKLEEKIGREINYHLYTKKEFKEKLKKDSFLKNILKDPLFLTDNQNEFKRLFK